jgi:hypothetical protein
LIRHLRWPLSRHGLRLLDVLALASSLQLALVSLGVGTIAYINGHRSVQLLARQLGGSIADQVDLQLDGVLEAPRLINRLNDEAIRSGRLDPENFAALERLFFEQISLFPVGYINYGNEAGDYLGIQRRDDGQLLVNEMRQRQAPNRQLIYTISAAGRQRQPLNVIEPIGTAREEPWYKERRSRPTGRSGARSTSGMTIRGCCRFPSTSRCAIPATVG